MSKYHSRSDQRAATCSTAGGQVAGARSSGTALSNTVPPNNNTGSAPSFLRTSIDSLYLSYEGELDPEMSARLIKCKELAQSQHRSEVPLAQLQLGTHTFEVNDKGSGIFPYVLRDGWYDLQISKLGAINKPMAFVKVSSALLSTKSLSFILSDLRDVVTPLGTLRGEANLSRVDLCADFTTDYPLESIRDVQWLTRAKLINRYTSGKRFSGFSIGSGGHLSARLYNKTLEMLGKPRPYLEDIWRQAGWDEWDEVWRLEFQFRRESIRELGLKTQSDLPDSLAGLWAYATHKWLRLVEPNPDDTAHHRWPLSPFWELMQTAPWTGDRVLSRVDSEKNRLPSDKSLFVNGLSGLTSYMAREGIDDPQEGAKRFLSAAYNFHESRYLFTGLDFYGYLMERVRQKQRQFNTALNPPDDGETHPAELAALKARKKAAEAYRKARDGE